MFVGFSLWCWRPDKTGRGVAETGHTGVGCSADGEGSEKGEGTFLTRRTLGSTVGR